MAQVKRMQVRLESLIEEKGVILDDSTCEDMRVILMEEEDQTITDKYPEDSFHSTYFGSNRRNVCQEMSSKKGDSMASFDD